jgi:hypothetical protein
VTVNDLLGKPDSFDIIIASQFDTICADVVCSEGSCYSTLMNGLSRGTALSCPVSHLEASATNDGFMLDDANAGGLHATVAQPYAYEP